MTQTPPETADNPDEMTPCPTCLHMNVADAEVCGDCGAALDTPDVEPTSPGVSEVLSAAPKDNLIRANYGPQSMEIRSSGALTGGSQLFGTFSKFGQWYEVNSLWEGTFMERVMPGAFADTIKNDRSNMRVLFDHGMDPHLGSATLGVISTLEERSDGPYYEVDLLDTDYNRDRIIPQLEGRLMNGTSAGSQLGASFRFQVQDETWNRRAKADRDNPDALPERSITRAKVFEFGPVTFPANAGASAGVRSMSDQWMARLAGDEQFMRSFSERVGTKVAQRVLASVPDDLRAKLATQPDTDVELRHDRLRRKARAYLTIGA